MVWLAVATIALLLPGGAKPESVLRGWGPHNAQPSMKARAAQLEGRHTGENGPLTGEDCSSGVGYGLTLPGANRVPISGW